MKRGENQAASSYADMMLLSRFKRVCKKKAVSRFLFVCLVLS